MNFFFKFIFKIILKILAAAQCPGGWYSPLMFGVNLNGCIFVNMDKTATSSWANGQRHCKELDPRSNLPYYTNLNEIKMFTGMTG